MVEPLFVAIGNFIKNVIVPPIDQILSKTCPYIPNNARNLWANYPDKKGRPMVYPYTFTAKFVQYPYQWQFKHGWVIKFFLIGGLLSFPIMLKISWALDTPENRALWKKIREDWYGPHSYHG